MFCAILAEPPDTSISKYDGNGVIHQQLLQEPCHKYFSPDAEHGELFSVQEL